MTVGRPRIKRRWRGADCDRWKELEPAAKDELNALFADLPKNEGRHECIVSAGDGTERELKVILEYTYAATLKVIGRHFVFTCLRYEKIDAHAG